MHSRLKTLAALAVAPLLFACSDSSDSPPPATSAPEPEELVSCAEVSSGALRTCLNEVNAALGRCYVDDGTDCADSNADLVAAFESLDSEISGACGADTLFGLSSEALTGRLTEACESHADALAWRSFGGPQAAVLAEADTSERDCLASAQERGTQFMDESLAIIDDCLAAGDCSTAEADRAAALQAAERDIAAACPDLGALVALQPATFLARTAEHVDCLAATSYEDTSGLALACGPGNVDTLPPRGEWTQLILPESKWGSRCGDGTDYAIQIKPAPEGEPLDRVLVALQGGGVCIFEEDCRARLDSGLFNAQDDEATDVGIAADTPDNPFAKWTKVYLPYCDQAVFTGGGVVEEFSDFSVNRFGSINLRAGVQAARDILWQMLDAEGGDGYRPDQVIALFGGFSAGAYGTIYNYHFMLDQLLWPRTIAFADAGGAYDNGGIGVRTLGDVKIPEWQVSEYLPPYCFAGECAVGPVTYRAYAPRLRQKPEQQLLVLSNQKDETQQRDAFFSDEAQFINTMRRDFCETRDLNGIHWYLTSESQESVHVVSIRDEFYYGDVAGERMVDWFERATADPDSIGDFAEEGDFVEVIEGVEAFPCELP